LFKKNRFLLSMIGIFVFLWFGLWCYQRILQSKTLEFTKITSPAAIDTLERLHISGVQQWILIRGWDVNNPILLFLHGGPGAPLFPFARELGINSQLEKHFIVIYWEQRGTGKSFNLSIPDSTMTIDQLKTDTYELVRYLEHRFPERKKYLVARSFGTLVGIQLVKEHPELFHAYVGISQIISPLKNDSISYENAVQAARQYHNNIVIEELKNIGYPPYSYQNLLKQRKWLTHFHDKYLKKQPLNYHYLLLSTVEYSLFDIILFGLNPYYSLKHLWNEQLYQINLFDEIKSIAVPIIFILGRHDIFTDINLVTSYYEKLIAPKGKWIFFFENSGHDPEMDEPEKLKDIILKYVISE
jgi:pimeloyl-ACP methyl ester carboxylesterase